MSDKGHIQLGGKLFRRCCAVQACWVAAREPARADNRSYRRHRVGSPPARSPPIRRRDRSPLARPRSRGNVSGAARSAADCLQQAGRRGASAAPGARRAVVARRRGRSGPRSAFLQRQRSRRLDRVRTVEPDQALGARGSRQDQRHVLGGPEYPGRPYRQRAHQQGLLELSTRRFRRIANSEHYGRGGGDLDEQVREAAKG